VLSNAALASLLSISYLKGCHMADGSPTPSGMAWFWFALASAVFAALTNIFGKIGVATIPSNMAMWIRVIVIFFVTTAFVIGRSEWIPPADIPRKTVLFLILSGIATGLSWLCYFRALQLGQAAQVGPVDKLSVVLVMIFAVAFLGESLNWRQWLGGALIVAGVILIALPAQKKEVPETLEKAQATGKVTT
jgi:transporter family protein